MLIRVLVLLCLLVPAPSFAAGETKNLSTFDVYLAPYFAPNYGPYEAGTVDNGTTMALQYGARLGFKLGPILLGGEFGGGYVSNDSKQTGMTNANKQKYAIDSTGSMMLLGAHLGIITDRWLFMATYYPAAEYEAKSVATGPTVTAKYAGNGYSAEINLRVYKRLYLGAFATTQEFNKFTSGALVDADLDPKWKSLRYGLMMSYLVAFSDFDSLPKLFQGL